MISGLDRVQEIMFDFNKALEEKDDLAVFEAMAQMAQTDPDFIDLMLDSLSPLYKNN